MYLIINNEKKNMSSISPPDPMTTKQVQQSKENYEDSKPVSKNLLLLILFVIVFVLLLVLLYKLLKSENKTEFHKFKEMPECFTYCMKEK